MYRRQRSIIGTIAVSSVLAVAPAPVLAQDVTTPAPDAAPAPEVPAPPTDLVDYVKRADTSFSWKLTGKKESDAGTIYELVTNEDGTQTPVPISFARWRDVYGLAPYGPAPTEIVRYPWSSTLYAVTRWPGGEEAWAVLEKYTGKIA